MKPLKRLPILVFIAFLIAIAFIDTGCNSASNENKDATVTDTTTAKPVADVEDTWVIDEHQVNQIPITTLAKTPNAKSITAKPKAKLKSAGKKQQPPAVVTSDTLLVAVEIDEYDIASVNEMNSMLNAVDYVSVDTITATESTVPLDETQTAIAYNKKGKEKGELQVVSDGDGNVEQVIFTNKKHRDVYNVEAGMSAKEVKKLRKEMKHMVKKGKVFLYNDDSNIMYMLDAADTKGNEVTEATIDNSNVQAIIWKDKKKK